jgi:hypothetical protein
MSKHIWKTQNNTNYTGNDIQNTEVITPCNHYNGPITTTPTIATQFQTLQQLKTLAFSITIPSHAVPMDTLRICHPYNHSVSSTFEIVHILQTLKPLERPDKYTCRSSVVELQPLDPP